MLNFLGKKIRELRDNRGYTLEKLAELSDSSKSYIWELENKAPPKPSAEKLFAIAAALGVSVDYFIDDGSIEPEERHLDEAFFWAYKRLPSEEKARLRAILKALKEVI